MKKFILSNILFFAILILFTINLKLYIVQYLNLSPYPIERFRIEKFISSNDTIEAITIGNSHNSAIDFNTLNISGYHLWEGGQDAFENKAFLSEILKDKKHIKTVFIPVDYLFFMDNKYRKQNNSSVRTRFYGVNNLLWLNGDFINWITSQHFFFYNLKPIEAKYNLIDFDGKKNDEGRYKSCLNDSYDFDKELEREGGHYDIIRLSREHENIENDVLEIYSDIISMLKKQKINVVFYAPPHYHEYITRLDNKYPDLWKSILKTIETLTKSDNCFFYNYMADSRFIFNKEIFFDDDHLNLLSGSTTFSKILKKDMKEMKIDTCNKKFKN